jgi:hypothetical protein
MKSRWATLSPPIVISKNFDMAFSTWYWEYMLSSLKLDGWYILPPVFYLAQVRITQSPRLHFDHPFALYYTVLFMLINL